MNDTAFLGPLIAIAIAIMLIKFAAIERRLNRLSRLDAKLDALLKASGIKWDEFQDVQADVREALQHGHKILAIKRVRDTTGIGLKEAKDYVEEIQRRGLSAS